jgi:hypothetical protein
MAWSTIVSLPWETTSCWRALSGVDLRRTRPDLCVGLAMGAFPTFPYRHLAPGISRNINRRRAARRRHHRPCTGPNRLRAAIPRPTIDRMTMSSRLFRIRSHSPSAPNHPADYATPKSHRLLTRPPATVSSIRQCGAPTPQPSHPLILGETGGAVRSRPMLAILIDD